MTETRICTICENNCPLDALACLKGQRFYEVHTRPYCTQCGNHCFLSDLQCERGRQFYGAVRTAAGQAQSGSLAMRFEMCWHQFRRVRGGLDGQIRVMRFLSNHGAAAQHEIQTALGIKSAAVSEHISKLESLGYITRASSEKDRRAKVIRFTAQGKKVFDQILAEESRKDLFACLTAEEQQTLKELLKKLSADWRRRESAK